MHRPLSSAYASRWQIMYSRVVLIIVHIAAVFISSCECQDDGIRISLGDRELPNHGLVTAEDIGIDKSGMRLDEGLNCSTTYDRCCTGTSTMTTASWHHAHVTNPVQLSDPSRTTGFYAFGMKRTGQAVYLFRNKVLSPPTQTDGIWRCTIPDQNGDQQTKYIGIYANGTTGALSAGTPSTIQFSIVNGDPVEFSLTFNTTGGPATIVTWTRDGDNISSLEDSHLYTPSQLVVPNGRVYRSGDYCNILTVNGRLPGVYGVSVTNDRTATPVTPTNNFTIIDFAHSNVSLNVARSQELTSISVSWTLVNSSFMEFFRSYEVQYTVCHIWSGDCETVQSQRINDFATTQYTVSDLTLWTNYNFTVLAEFDTPMVNESTHILPTPVSTGYHTITILGVLASEITSVIELANITSVQVIWNQPEGGLAVDEYVVSYRRLDGRDGQCSSFQDEGNVTVMVGGEGETILYLKAHHSTYIVNVTGRKGNLYNTSSQNFETNSTVPSEAPQNFTIINSNFTSVTVSWNSVDCIHRNGLITHYIILYGPVDETNLVRVNSSRPDDGGRYTATELDATQNYLFKVAAVNSDGIGVFATVSTNKPFQAPELDSTVRELANITSVQVTWNQPEGGLTADEYVVSYRRLSGRDGQCSSFQDEGNVVLNSLMGDGLTYTINLHLQAYSVYVVNVTGRTGGLQNTSNVTRFETNSTVPSGAPQSLSFNTINSTSVNISWDSVECIHRNGLITHYNISYGPVGETSRVTDVTVVNKNEQDNGGSYTATGLEPSTNYNFKVAAVNDVGVGKFANVQVQIEAMTTGKTTGNTGGAGGLPAAIGAIIAVLFVLAVVILIIVLVVVFYRRRNTHQKHGVSKDNLISLSSVSYRKSDSQDDGTNKEYKTESKNAQASSFSKSVAGSQGPSIEDFPQDTTVVEGLEVTFKVVVSGYPQPSLQWYHDNKEIATDYSREVDDNGNLYLPSCEKWHGGEYKLVAKNSSASVDKRVQLTVLSEAEAPPAKDVDLSPVPVMEFGSFVANNHKNNNAGFKDLYEALDKGDNHATAVGLSPENKKLNRFANMTVYDDNRIVLKPTQVFSGGAQFVNASYIDGYSAPRKFIATQGPLPHTLTDFWRLVLQEKVHTIVMVTNLREGKKEKCHQYWPDTGSVDCGPINVAITDQQILADYTVRSFYVRVENSSEQPLKVTQYHFTAWPDHGVPTYATSILAFHRRIKSQHKPKRGPMLVHCSAGVGRTGTFIAIDGIQEQVEKEKFVDIAGVVNKMRHQRMKMVQTQDQFMFIHDAILETVMCGDTQVDAADLRVTLMKMEKTDSNTQKTILQRQFEVLAQVSPNPNQGKCPTALRHSNKNRRADYLPTENHRAILKGEFPDYINATNVDGYKHKRAYIIAEGPMDSTARNFWKVVSDRKCGVIVMCSDFVENGEESSCRYWPESGEKKFGEFNVVLLDQEECPGYTIRKLSIQMKKKPLQQVTHFHITNWDIDGQCSNLKSITDVIENVSIAQRRTGNNPIVVHCHDTVGRSGMFCAIMSTIERCKTEGVVDVFQVTKALRVQKPGAVLNVEQYHSVFNAVLTYLDSFDTYANFQSV